MTSGVTLAELLLGLARLGKRFTCSYSPAHRLNDRWTGDAVARAVCHCHPCCATLLGRRGRMPAPPEENHMSNYQTAKARGTTSGRSGAR